MKDDNSKNYWGRTHFIEILENRKVIDRRKSNCFIYNDRRSGIACRRKERQRRIDRKVAFSKITFYPEYYRVA